MRWFSIIAIFFLFWFLAIFVVLPLNRYARKIIPQLQQLEAKGPQ